MYCPIYILSGLHIAISISQTHTLNFLLLLRSKSSLWFFFPPYYSSFYLAECNYLIFVTLDLKKKKSLFAASDIISITIKYCFLQEKKNPV